MPKELRKTIQIATAVHWIVRGIGVGLMATSMTLFVRGAATAPAVFFLVLGLVVSAVGWFVGHLKDTLEQTQTELHKATIESARRAASLAKKREEVARQGTPRGHRSGRETPSRGTKKSRASKGARASKYALASEVQDAPVVSPFGTYEG